jgi:hypothetical protein
MPHGTVWRPATPYDHTSPTLFAALWSTETAVSAVCGGLYRLLEPQRLGCVLRGL